MERIQDSAKTARLKLFTYDTFPIDISTALERVGDLGGCPRPRYLVVPDNQMRFDEAYTDGDERLLYVSRNTLDSAVSGSPHHRFTIAHELGHLALLHRGIRSRAFHGRDFRKQAGIPKVLGEEVDANRWAAHFLVPSDKLDQHATIEQVAKTFGVSFSMAKARLAEESALQRKLRNELRPIPERTRALIEEIRRSAGTQPLHTAAPVRSRAIDDPIKSAQYQGYLPERCPSCHQYCLLLEGGCMTCRNCGESDCN